MAEKSPRAERFGNDRGDRGCFILFALAFVVHHPERPVAAVIDLRNQHRPAQNKSELVPLQNIFAERPRAEIVPGIENIVAKELEQRAVQLIGAGTCEDLDLRAGIVPVLGRIRSGMHLELLNGFDGCAKEGRVIDVPRGAHAVVENLALILAHSVGADRDRGIAAAVLIRVRRDAFDDARHQPGKVGEVAAVQRQVGDALLFDDVAHSGIVGVQNDAAGAYLDRFADRADAQLHIDARFLVQLQE